MPDIGWSEMAVIALLTLLVIGPKELPRVMRTVGHWLRKAQSLAREFQSGLDQMVQEAELEDAKNDETPAGGPDEPAAEMPETAPDETPEEEPAQSTIVKHPVQVAPPHSLKSPPESGAEAKPEPEPEPAAEPEDGSQKTA
jgi:sec-independent protein translocase protein TatB